MKEKLIAFTRNKINLIWMFLPILILLVLVFTNAELMVVSIIPKVESSLIITIMIQIFLLLWLAILGLFWIEKGKFESNKISTLLLSNEYFVCILIYHILKDIVKYGMQLSTFIADIFIIISPIILSILVAKYFSKKIK